MRQKILLIESPTVSAEPLVEQLIYEGYSLVGLPRSLYHNMFVSQALVDFLDFDLVIFVSTPQNLLLIEQCRRIKFILGIPAICILHEYHEGIFIDILDSGFDHCCILSTSPGLLSQVRSVLRREAYITHEPLEFDKIRINTHERKAYLKGKQIESLSAREFDLLMFMLYRRGFVLSLELLGYLLGGRSLEHMERKVEVLIGSLRLKIEPDPLHPHYIRTVRGVGYMFIDE
jgi:two-component system, OmpR family, response regulator